MGRLKKKKKQVSFEKWPYAAHRAEVRSATFHYSSDDITIVIIVHGAVYGAVYGALHGELHGAIHKRCPSIAHVAPRDAKWFPFK